MKFLVAWKADMVRGGGEGEGEGAVIFDGVFNFIPIGREVSYGIILNRTNCAGSTRKLFCGVAGGLCYPVREDAR